MKHTIKSDHVHALLLAIGLLTTFTSLAVADELPVNLAPLARVSASSRFSDAYRPDMAVNNVIPSEFRQDQDWAVKGTQTGWFSLRWDKAVEATQIIYYARVTSPLLETFKDYEVYLNDADQAAVSGTLEHRRGPQIIAFPKQKVTKIRLVFLSSYPGSPNPGAAEIAVYGTEVTEKQLAEMRIPPEEKTPEALTLRRELLNGKLGFKEILLVKRKPLNISHVYVYHVEGFRPGGGLYRFSPNEKGGDLVCIFDAADGMITTADLSYDGREVVFAMRRGGLVASNPVAHIEDISRNRDEKSNYHLYRINIDGSGLTQLTHGTYNNACPLTTSWTSRPRCLTMERSSTRAGSTLTELPARFRVCGPSIRTVPIWPVSMAIVSSRRARSWTPSQSPGRAK
ncbi:MAG: DUF7402 domain-containing protein [Planctomycetota bacterium]|jgi:hypothetical protein